MCGRFTLTTTSEQLAQHFQIADVPAFPFQYNIAPGQIILGVWQLSENPPQFTEFHWGFIPNWQKADAKTKLVINARAETVDEKPMFKQAFLHRRCLIVADGYYEWQATEHGKQPYYFALKDHSVFAFAGIWSPAKPEENRSASCAIIVTEATGIVKSIHDRMPVILNKADYAMWLDPQFTQAEALKTLLKQPFKSKLICYPVSKQVNAASNNLASNITPLES